MKNLPHIGMRTVKTAVVVFLSLVVSWLRQGQSNPLYIAVAAILAIQPTMESSRDAGINRLVGTIVGGVWGIAVFLINVFVLKDVHIIAQYAFISLAIIPLILTDLGIKRPSTVAASCVVFLIITTSPIGEINPLKFVWGRLLDTFLGFAIAIVVNRIRLPQKQEQPAENLSTDNLPVQNREEEK